MHRAVGGSKILSEMWLAEPQWAQTIGKRLVRGRDGTSSHLLLGVSAGPCPPGQARWMRSPLPDAHLRLVRASDAHLVRANSRPSLWSVLPAAARLHLRDRPRYWWYILQ